MSRRDRKLAYIRAVDQYVKTETKRKKQLKVIDWVLKIAAAVMLVAAIQIMRGGGM